MKKALLLCATHNDLGLIKALRKLGYYIITTGNIPGQPGEKLCDRYISADYSDKDAVLNIAKRENVDAIVQCCNDFGVYTASYVAENLGLPGYDSFETACILHNKDKFKKFAHTHNIYSPISHVFEKKELAIKWLYKQRNYFPFIIKPIDASAGNGVSKINFTKDIEITVEKAFEYSRQGRIVIEPFIEGSQHGFCTFLINRKVVAVCSNDEYSIINPYRVEIDTYPASNFALVKDTLVKQIEYIANILSLKDGIFHLQYIFDGNQAHIIEVMRRILGNMYSIPCSMLTNLDWDYWETRARCGLSLDNFPKNIIQEGYFSYKAIMAPKNGIIKKINIPSNYRKYIYYEFWLKNNGDYIENYLSTPIGFLFMAFSSLEEMRQTLIDEYALKVVEMEE